VALGDLIDEPESIPMLIGQLTLGLTSIIPSPVTMVIGTVADVRDTLGSLFHGHFVQAGLNAIGLIPFVGDAIGGVAEIAEKIHKFIMKFADDVLKFVPNGVSVLKYADGISSDAVGIFIKSSDGAKYLDEVADSGKITKANFEDIGKIAKKADIKIPNVNLSKIAQKFGKFECVEAMKVLAKELIKKGFDGKILKMEFVGGNGIIICTSDNDETISTNGKHYGIEYDNKVYCNIHPLGIERTAWANDFNGTGTKTITEYPLDYYRKIK
jgi:hypothetical protein